MYQTEKLGTRVLKLSLQEIAGINVALEPNGTRVHEPLLFKYSGVP